MITISHAGLHLWWKEKKGKLTCLFCYRSTVTGVGGSYSLKGKHLCFFFWKDQEELGWQSMEKRAGKAADTCLGFRKKAKVVTLGFLWVQPSWTYGRLSRNKAAWSPAWEEGAPNNIYKNAQLRVGPEKRCHFRGLLKNAKTSGWNFEDVIG